MLTELNIKNFAIIDELKVSFGDGLSVISGETGAGKSIIIGAVGILLGEKASGEMIRSSEDMAVVEALFDIGGMEALKKRLKQMGFYQGDDLVIKRVSNTPTINFSSNITINGAICCDTGIDFNYTGLTINASNSNRNAAIQIGSSTDTITKINSAPTIILGPNQRYAILARSDAGGNVIVNVNANLTNSEITKVNKKQATIIAHSETGDSEVKLGTGVDIEGLIYAYGNSANTSITLDSDTGTDTGILVTNGTVNLNGGTLIWDSRPFVDATNTDTQIYQGFYGGRRVYLPVLGSWRMEE